ncbi:hypothetical protein [uncultured Chryseobacterium sp.]|uniref:hypothetical protein n=1 Tax=uncultured Chryseobacterium sp. TaxID=259322 RepID=UPI0027DCB3E1|nr:hypothetical protein [uncultured Chryseobacterium sp.]
MSATASVLAFTVVSVDAVVAGVADSTVAVAPVFWFWLDVPEVVSQLVVACEFCWV